MALDDNKSVAELAAEIKADHAKAFDQVKEIAENALGKAASGEEVAASVKDKADEALLKMNGLAEQIAEFEQKLARSGSGQKPESAKSLGERVIESDGFKGLLDKGTDFRGVAQFQAKATITSSTADADGAVGAAVPETRLPGVVAPPNRRMTIRDLITPGQMDGSTLEYVRETGFNNNAATVAEGAPKPQSDIKMELVNTSAKVIAHTAKASRQILDDAAWMRSYIDGRLRYGLSFQEEYQLLSADGTGQNILGIIPQATAYLAPSGSSAATQYLDTMRLAMLQAVLAEYPATGHVMNPIDWANIEMLKDADGRYIIGNPQGMAAPTLWGLPVVATQAMQVDKFLTGAFRLGAQVFDRWQARVEIATENEDDFVKNLVTMLCEERLALAVYRPEAFVYGDFGNIA